MIMGKRIGSLLSLAMLALAGCAPSPVTVELNFPTSSAFLHSTTGRLLAFPLTADQLGICPELLANLAASSFPLDPVYDSELVDVCDFRGGMQLPELVGPHAYLVEVRSESMLILAGCSIGEVFAGAETIEVALQPTDASEELLSMPTTGTPDTRCGGGS